MVERLGAHAGGELVGLPASRPKLRPAPRKNPPARIAVPSGLRGSTVSV
jgi:hypothetical protein